MRFAFYISGTSNRVLKFLKEASEAEKNSVKLIFSNRKLEPEIKEIIQALNIYFYERDLKEFEGNNMEERRISFSNELLRELTENKIDYCFSFGKYIIAGDVISKYRHKIINFHPSILPMYPGTNSIDQAINDKRSLLLIGNTAHFIDAGTDTGPIIMQYVVPLQTFFNSQGNYNVVLDAQLKMLHKVFKILEENRITVDEEERVHIAGADYDKGYFFPHIEE